MTTRDRVRDREERDRRAQQAQARTNEYFVPKDGIDREVITADICRYLGNDALVRPGQYENPQTRQVQQGFFITAYRNLTTAMIADLKADSERWEQERRATQSRGQPSNVEYRASTTHQSRQYYGPTSETAQPTPLGYQQPSSTSTSTGQVYDSSAQGGYPQQSSYAQPPSAYQQSQGYAAVQDSSNYYMAGADMAIDRSSAGRVPVTTQSPIPRSNVQYATSSSTYPQQQDSRNMYSPYQQPGVAVSSAQYSQPQDAYYPSRAVPPAGAYDSQDPYGERVYQDSSAYSQIPVTAAPAVAPAPANSSSRRSERESERERDRHGQRRRH